MADLTGKLEPEAQGASSPEAAALLSIAVSLKRLADAMGGPINHYGETLGEAIQNQIVRGLRGIG